MARLSALLELFQIGDRPAIWGAVKRATDLLLFHELQQVRKVAEAHIAAVKQLQH